MLSFKPFLVLLLMILSSISTYLITKGSQLKNESEILISSELSWNGTIIPDYPEGKPKISILKITIPPGSSLPKHIHPVINAGVLTKGELFVEDEFGNQLNMKAGDPIIEVVNTVHYGENRGTIPAEIIVFYAGSEGLTITKIMEDQ
ncbi:cupin domain-containing protein [Algoriphagus halophilus]|uniref:Cupin domain-containing protein n=1 Tax=Algoriphagus halophilus TaxID=226505 RepID=A0A1N6D850_9BACT|nr:cupin domain-containing protein [Algoriphagus halophilus]SIN66887.1 Cupin domain-containing protein [Algoriphagus halophilus]